MSELLVNMSELRVNNEEISSFLTHVVVTPDRGETDELFSNNS